MSKLVKVWLPIGICLDFLHFSMIRFCGYGYGKLKKRSLPQSIARSCFTDTHLCQKAVSDGRAGFLRQPCITITSCY